MRRQGTAAGWPQKEHVVKIALNGKVLVFTGAGSGLGFEYARACARAGARVVINDIDSSVASSAVAAITEEGGEAFAVVGSVADWDLSERLVAEAIRRYGVLDGIVLNAAVMHMAEPWNETEAGLRRIVEVNVLGVQFAAAHAMRALVDAGRGGAVLTVVSGALFGIAGMSAYGATKGAVASMTYNWAIEGLAHGIRVNAISPTALTKMTTDHMARAGATANDFTAPESIAPAVVAMLSDEAATLTGRMIRFDGHRLSEYENAVTLLGERGEWTSDDVAGILAGLDAGLPRGDLRISRP